MLVGARPRKATEGRQARPERFETRIYALVRAIDLTLGGRGRLWPAGSEQTHALFAERDLEEQDDGSWLRASKSWPGGGVFHCYIAAQMYPKDGVRTSDRSPSPLGLGVSLKKNPDLSFGMKEYRTVSAGVSAAGTVWLHRLTPLDAA